MIEVVRDKGFYDKLSFVNSTVNRLIAYKKDSLVYGEFDYWAKPLEILDRRAGDCEDFAILKMTALQRARYSGAEHVACYSPGSQEKFLPCGPVCEYQRRHLHS
ncbi:transglutaminase-like cysteine peptidase (plasmid) [Mesorhizobium atlanticum]|uniref:transglutaminase-like cysteine peptidase n=1 Tax=Mesorhizobium atlanticum TaxID=2233532 RepID=UPI0037045901